MDLKSALFGSILSLAVGGGIYGLYLKQIAPAAFSEVSGYELLGKCVVFNSNPILIPTRLKEIESFLKDVESQFPEIAKADAVVTMVAISAGEKNGIPAGMGKPLQMCIQDLEQNVEKHRK